MSTLAIHGGKPVIEKKLPPCFPGALLIDDREEKAVLEVLKSKSLFRYYGPKPLFKVKSFEEMFAKYIGCRYGLGVTSGTAALFISYRALGLSRNDKIIVPAYTWISTPLAAVYCNARIVISDIDESLNMDPTVLDDLIRKEDVKIIVPVHMRGASADIESIVKIARENDVKVVEDTAQSCGGSFKNRMLGSWGDMGCFSFQLNKNITAGEGGAITTNDEELYRRAVAIHDVAAYYRNPEHIPPIPGLNFRMNEITAAILIEQLKKIGVILDRMRNVKKIIREYLEKCSELTPRKIYGKDTAVCVVFFLKSDEKARLFAKALSREGVPSSTLYSQENRYDGHIWVNWKPLIEKYMIINDMGKRTLNLLSRAVHISISPLMTEEDGELIGKAILKVYKHIH